MAAFFDSLFNIIGIASGVGLFGFCLLVLLASGRPEETVVTTIEYVNCTEDEWNEWRAYNEQKNQRAVIKEAV
ncbi:hypothetical protein [Paenibacillus alvei]|uniref:hypothetical protein n=1 Tax=Paenibacillus alvei TaxID=44250 RepID=UPI0013DC76B5|nr:hypothetical protein [Paenibacillus alvei]NEZ44415.1 hypothetical protein [Paenibacillus alvei]